VDGAEAQEGEARDVAVLAVEGARRIDQAGGVGVDSDRVEGRAGAGGVDLPEEVVVVAGERPEQDLGARVGRLDRRVGGLEDGGIARRVDGGAPEVGLVLLVPDLVGRGAADRPDLVGKADASAAKAAGSGGWLVPLALPVMTKTTFMPRARASSVMPLKVA
jgi:hypothetical protein